MRIEQKVTFIINGLFTMISRFEKCAALQMVTWILTPLRMCLILYLKFQ